MAGVSDGFPAKPGYEHPEKGEGSPLHALRYSAFRINPKPQEMKKWNKSDPRLQDDRASPNRVYRLSSHLAEMQGLKMLIQWRGGEGTRESLTDWVRCHCRPHPSVGRRTGRDL